MAYVCSGHQKILIADFRRASLDRAAMNGAVLADDVVVADLDLRFSIRRERNILRRRSDHRAMSNEIADPYCDIAFNDNV